MPELHIITGSNGAGKSAIGGTFLPSNIQKNNPVFDGDKLYMQKQRELWESGVKAIKEAKKIAFAFVVETFERLVEESILANTNFVYEGHFTNDETWKIPMRFKENGYKINLLFLGLKNPDLSEERVLDRTKTGGHYVSRVTIEDNFYGNLEKLNKYYTIIDSLMIIDTSTSRHSAIASFVDATPAFSVPYRELPDWFTTYLPALAEKIK